MTYVIVDLETTGLSPYKHAITEIAAVRFDGNTIKEDFQTLVNPQRHVPMFITRLTWITNEMVESAPTIDQILPEFISFLGDDIFVAHNISFDIGFLNYARYEYQQEYFNNRKLCTRKLARHLIPELPKRNLSFLCDHFAIKNTRAHRALSDVYATSELLKNYISIAKQQGIHIDQYIE
jgi:DNA polymerase III epsilon subunit family exonuclease